VSLVVRPKGCVKAYGFADNATPSGSAMARMVLFKLGAYTGEARDVKAAEGLKLQLTRQDESITTLHNGA
jgi:uncharacterized protein YyaL (SSP411 family)